MKLCFDVEQYDPRSLKLGRITNREPSKSLVASVERANALLEFENQEHEIPKKDLWDAVSEDPKRILDLTMHDIASRALGMLGASLNFAEEINQEYADEWAAEQWRPGKPRPEHPITACLNALVAKECAERSQTAEDWARAMRMTERFEKHEKAIASERLALLKWPRLSDV